MSNKVDDSKRYDFVTGQLRYFSDRMRDSFKLYIQVVTGIIGGLIFFLSQSTSNVTPEVTLFTQTIGPAAIIFVGFFLALQIAVDFQCWYGYRIAEHYLTEGRAPLPSFPDSAWAEIWFVSGMTAGSVFGSYYLWSLLGLDLHWLWAVALWIVSAGIPVRLMSQSGQRSSSKNVQIVSPPQERPNKAPEPTPVAVTPRAIEGDSK